MLYLFKIDGQANDLLLDLLSVYNRTDGYG